MKCDGYDRKTFGISWMIISGILEIWWLIAVITSAVLAAKDENEGDCGWSPVDGGDWFVLIVLIIIFFGQFSIGELIGLIEYQKSQKINIAYFPKGMIVCFQVIMGIYVILNILAIANAVDEQSYECMTGQIMFVTIVINLVYCIICFIFSFISLPLSDINNPDNQNKAKQIPQKDDDDTDIEIEENVKEEDKPLNVDNEQKENDKNTETAEEIQS